MGLAVFVYRCQAFKGSQSGRSFALLSHATQRNAILDDIVRVIPNRRIYLYELVS